MKLSFIPLDKLSVSKTNMRYGKKAPDVSDILPTVRSRGVLQPIIVRPNCAPDGYEIVAGSRRFHAARIVADERRAGADPVNDGEDIAVLPCAILDDGDDADAVEASMIENMARLDPDEVTRWETFTRLVKEGRSVEDIGATFGLPDLAIRRVLALGNLLPRIRDLYRKQEIDAATVRHLTMASKSQQKAWLALADDDNAYWPTGHQLKSWLFGGASIPVKYALFDVAASGISTIADLFGEDRYFADADAFWPCQNEAIETRRNALIEEGWADAIIVPPSAHFSTWEYEKAGKRKGGRVYIAVRSTGEVTIHEGYISRKEAQRIAKGGDTGTTPKVVRPEMTSTMKTYVDLHRHAAVRAELTAHTGVALRLMLAHVIAGSSLWTVRTEPQLTRNDDVRDSLDNAPAEANFDQRRRAVLAVLGFDDDAPTVTSGNGDDTLVALFHRLTDLPDALVVEIIAIVMGETLASGSEAVEAVGLHLGVDMARYWRADAAFLDLLRDKEVLTRIVAEVAGETVAAANASEKTKTLKRIIHDRLDGENGRDPVTGWVPRWMTFPPTAYTTRGAAMTAVTNDVRRVEPRDTGWENEGDDDPDPAAPAGAVARCDDDDAADPVPLAA
ncbi:ParB/RepB/Spo0J family partition protein [soil metagenome]